MQKRHDDLNDDLSDLIGSAPRAAVTPPDSYQPKQFVEPCPKCHGSGRYGNFGPCFKCNGSGKVTFKTPFEDRQRSRSGARARTAKKADQYFEDFRVGYPEIAAWIDGSKDFSFAVAMGDAVRKWGSLTANQLAACERSIAAKAKAQAERTDRVENAPAVSAVSIDKMKDAFTAAAKSGLKRPRLRIAGLVFAPAKADSPNAGAIYVKIAGGEYLGKISAGRFIAVRACGNERAAKIVEIAADPKAAASSHGKMTGNCSCCGRLLTDPVSVANGIGPICAAGWGF